MFIMIIEPIEYDNNCSQIPRAKVRQFSCETKRISWIFMLPFFLYTLYKQFTRNGLLHVDAIVLYALGQTRKVSIVDFVFLR